jgi:hypothetical protein
VTDGKGAAGEFVPDPVSLLWSTLTINKLLNRARQARGEWVRTRVANPNARTMFRLIAMGYQWADRDPAPGGKAKDRWTRSFIRVLERERKARGMTIEWDAGRRLPALGVIPAGREFALRTRPGGVTAIRMKARKPPGTQIHRVSDGQPGARWGDPKDRDW